MNIKAFAKRTMAIATGMVLSACCLLGDKVTLSAAGSFDIELSAHTDGYGSVSLDWSGYNYADKNFKVYKSDDGGLTYETVGIDYTLVDEVKCLQIYPVEDAQNQFKTWMETNGNGKGIIKIDSVYIDSFNENPDMYLKDFNGNYKYDVVLLGTWDSNGDKDLTQTSVNSVIRFIKSGRGCILGHDTFLRHHTIDFIYFRQLGPYFGLTTHDLYQNPDPNNNSSENVKIVNNGLFTNYPWYIGEVGDVLNIPRTHNTGQRIDKATKWLEFCDISEGHETALSEDNYYLATYNNCASIMTGHSMGTATEDEQKILANLIFYCNQLIFDTWYSKDSSAQDFAAPDAPTISSDINKIFFSAEDNGSTYHYYVESFDKNDTSESGLIDRSPVKSLTVTTGVQKYLYILDDNENTVVSKENGIETTDMNVPMNRDFTYIHVAAIDGAGNLSETTTMTIPKNTVNVKTNIKQPVSVNIKMLDDNGGYNGIQYNISANEFGKVIKHMPVGKFEIQIIDRSYELKDIFIEDNTNNIYTVKENEKYYLIIDNSTKNEVGTIMIKLNEKFNYQLDSSMNNYFK